MFSQPVRKIATKAPLLYLGKSLPSGLTRTASTKYSKSNNSSKSNPTQAFSSSQKPFDPTSHLLTVRSQSTNFKNQISTIDVYNGKEISLKFKIEMKKYSEFCQSIHNGDFMKNREDLITKRLISGPPRSYDWANENTTTIERPIADRLALALAKVIAVNLIRFDNAPESATNKHGIPKSQTIHNDIIPSGNSFDVSKHVRGNPEYKSESGFTSTIPDESLLLPHLQDMMKSWGDKVIELNGEAFDRGTLSSRDIQLILDLSTEHMDSGFRWLQNTATTKDGSTWTPEKDAMFKDFSTELWFTAASSGVDPFKSQFTEVERLKIWNAVQDETLALGIGQNAVKQINNNKYQ